MEVEQGKMMGIVGPNGADKIELDCIDEFRGNNVIVSLIHLHLAIKRSSVPWITDF